MPRLSLLPFNDRINNGLWINGAREYTPSSYFRRLTGMHAIRERLLRSRDGTTVDVAVAASHSLTRFDDVRFQGAGTTLFRAGVSILTGLDGSPLDFIVSEPRTGTEDEYLFTCGGALVRKVDTTGTVTQWGIDPPTGGTWGVLPPGNGEDDSGVIVNDPQEDTIADTTSTTGWLCGGNDLGNVFLFTDNVPTPSGSAVCCNVGFSADNDDIQQDVGEGPDVGDLV